MSTRVNDYAERILSVLDHPMTLQEIRERVHDRTAVTVGMAVLQARGRVRPVGVRFTMEHRKRVLFAA